MIEVIVEHLRPDRVLMLVQDLRAQGLVQGRDFDFSFEQSQWDNFTGIEKVRRTKFLFYAEKYATMFALKYGT